MKDGGGPVFPVPMIPTGRDRAGYTEVCSSGLTIRDWFAGMALCWLIAEPSTCGDVSEFARRSYVFADAMIVAREKCAQ